MFCSFFAHPFLCGIIVRYHITVPVRVSRSVSFHSPASLSPPQTVFTDGFYSTNIKIQWRDEDGELITIATDADLAEAISAAAGNPVKVVCSTPETTPTTAGGTVPAPATEPSSAQPATDAAMVQHQQPARCVRWGQSEVRCTTPQPGDEEGAPRDSAGAGAGDTDHAMLRRTAPARSPSDVLALAATLAATFAAQHLLSTALASGMNYALGNYVSTSSVDVSTLVGDLTTATAPTATVSTAIASTVVRAGPPLSISTAEWESRTNPFAPFFRNYFME